MRATSIHISGLTILFLLCAAAACSSEVDRVQGAGGGLPLDCPPSQVACHDVCVDVDFDREHCGACDAACEAEQVCSAGSCGLECVGQTTNCVDKCVDTQLDALHCGACNIACPSGQVCSSGMCGLQCAGGTTKCGRACVDTQTDPANCGMCDQPCGSGEYCQGGLCESVCGNLTLCGNVCADTQTNNDHCGMCANACASTQSCVAGSCKDAYLSSCQAILAANKSMGDGVYTIDPDGGGQLPPLSVYCDMTKDGGGWTYRVHQDLVAYWSFDDNNFKDADFGSYTSSPSSTTHSTEVAANGLSKSVSFNNTESSRMALSPAIKLGAKTTIVYWARNTSCTNNQIPVIIDSTGYVGDLYWDKGASVNIGSSIIFRSSSPNCANQNGVWRHLAFVDDGTTFKVFHNGTTVAPSTYSYASLNAHEVTYFGSRPAFGTNGLGGQFDEFAVYNRALSIGELKTIYDEAVVGRGIRYK